MKEATFFKKGPAIYVGLLCLGILSFYSCRKAIEKGPNGNINQGTVEFDNSAENAARMDNSNGNTAYPLVKLGNENLSELKSVDSSFGYYYLAVGELPAPTFWGGELKATTVEIEDDLAYIGYHLPGPQYAGAIDVVDISDPEDPTIIQTVKFADMDILSIKIDGLRIYAAGARDTEVLTELNSAAAIAAADLSFTGTVLHPLEYAEVPGNVATSVDHTASLIYAATGNNDGGVAMVNKSNMQLVAFIEQEGAKGLSFDPFGLGFHLLYDDGVDAGIDFYPLGIPTPAFGYSIPSGINPDSRSGIEFSPLNGLTLVANGYNGVNTYAGSLIDFIPLPTSLPGVDPSDIYTNSVDWDGEYAYGANGGAGLQVAKNYGGLLAVYGSVDVGSSANDVAADDGSIFVATAEGLQIFSLEKIDFSPLPPALPLPAPAHIDRVKLADVNFGAYRTGESQAHHFTGQTKLAALDVNSNSHFSFDGSFTADGMAVVRNAVLETKGEADFHETLAIDKNGSYIVDGDVTIDGDFYLNGTVIFQTPGSKLRVNGNIYKGTTGRVINPENNSGDDI